MHLDYYRTNPKEVNWLPEGEYLVTVENDDVKWTKNAIGKLIHEEKAPTGGIHTFSSVDSTLATLQPPSANSLTPGWNVAVRPVKQPAEFTSDNNNNKFISEKPASTFNIEFYP